MFLLDCNLSCFTVFYYFYFIQNICVCSAKLCCFMQICQTLLDNVLLAIA